jgi:hypothetical protein
MQCMQNWVHKLTGSTCAVLVHEDYWEMDTCVDWCIFTRYVGDEECGAFVHKISGTDLVKFNIRLVVYC